MSSETTKKISQMTLGTVQLGMNYGISNDLGMPDEEKSFSMLRSALENGVNALDTARAYGVSEEVIGKFLKTWDGETPYIATKVKPVGDDSSQVENNVINSVETSLQKLGVNKVDSIMLHQTKDLYQHKEKIAAAMEKLLKMGYTDQIGVSIYTKEDIDEILKYPQFSVTQVPISIFDQRIIASGHNLKLKDRGYTVFVRSVFLQGLFFLDPDKIEDPILLEHAAPKIKLLRDIAKSEDMSIAQLAIAFMRDTVGITSLVLGADTTDQVKQNISYFNTPTLSQKIMKQLNEEFANVNIPEIMKVLSRPKA